MSFMDWLSAVWHRVHEPLVFLRPLRFIVVPQLILWWALDRFAQGQDAMRLLVEFPRYKAHWWVLLWFVGTVLLLALQSLYWSRQLLRVDFPHVPTAYKDGDDRKLEMYAPRYIGAVPFVIAIESVIGFFFEKTPRLPLYVAIAELLAA